MWTQSLELIHNVLVETELYICWLVNAVSRKSTKILCSVQNGQTSEACTKVLRDLNFVHRQAAGEPAR